MKDRDEEELEKIIFRASVVAVVFFVIGIIGLLYVTFH
jgi:preprotein translocase subunit Sss1